ncbi:MAG: flagellin, partial [Desulfobulbus sp.]
TLIQPEGRDIILQGYTSNPTASITLTGHGGDAGTITDTNHSSKIAGIVEFSSEDSYTIQSTLTGANGALVDADQIAQLESVTAIDISDVAGANDALKIVDSALSKIDAQRGELGAMQNRFESTISNLQNVAENLTAARSRILDADIAQETSNMTKNNILQQAGVSILTQANQTPQLALQLLQG